MTEHDDLAARLTDAARRPVDPMAAHAVDLLEQRLQAMADDDRTITPVGLPPRVRRRTVLVTAAAIGTAAAAVTIAVAVTGAPDRSLTPSVSGSEQPTEPPTTTAIGTSTAPRASTATPTTSGPASTGPGTLVDAVPVTIAPSGSEPSTTAALPVATTAATTPPTTGTRPAPTTTRPSSPATTTTTAVPPTTMTQQPLPEPTLTLTGSRSGTAVTFTWSKVSADGFGQYVLARVPPGGISTWPSGTARVVARVRFAVRGSVTVDVARGEDRSFVLIALDGDQRVIAVSNVLTVPG